MKKPILIVLLILYGVTAVAQGNAYADTTIYEHEYQTAPFFSGGNARFKALFKEKFKQPNKQKPGYVIDNISVYFVVEKNGDISRPFVSANEKIGEQQKKDIITAFKTIKGWQAATIYKKAVRARYNAEVPVWVKQRPVNKTLVIEPQNGNEIFTAVETLPQPQKGYKAFYKYIEDSRDKSVKGKGWVYATFIVEKNGLVTDAKIKQGLNDKADAEAIRLLSNSIWRPGLQCGRPVRSQFTLPVAFD